MPAGLAKKGFNRSKARGLKGGFEQTERREGWARPRSEDGQTPSLCGRFGEPKEPLITNGRPPGERPPGNPVPGLESEFFDPLSHADVLLEHDHVKGLLFRQRKLQDSRLDILRGRPGRPVVLVQHVSCWVAAFFARSLYPRCEGKVDLECPV